MGQPEIENVPGYLIKRVQQALRRSCDAALRPAGLSMAQYAVLRALADNPRASAAELARLCFVTRQSLRDVLSGLRSAGLVGPADTSPGGRAQALQLTPLGKRRFRAGHAAVLSADAAMTQGFSVQMRKELSYLLTLCAENLENPSS